MLETTLAVRELLCEFLSFITVCPGHRQVLNVFSLAWRKDWELSDLHVGTLVTSISRTHPAQNLQHHSGLFKMLRAVPVPSSCYLRNNSNANC